MYTLHVCMHTCIHCMYICIHVYMIYWRYTSFAILDTKHLPMLGHFKQLLNGTGPSQISWGDTFWQHCHTLSYLQSKNFGELPNLKEISRNFTATNPQKKCFLMGRVFPARSWLPVWLDKTGMCGPFFRSSARGETWANHEGTSL